MLLFDTERGPDADLRFQFEEVSKFDADDKKAARPVVDGLICAATRKRCRRPKPRCLQSEALTTSQMGETHGQITLEPLTNGLLVDPPDCRAGNRAAGALNRVSLAGFHIHDLETLGVVNLEQMQKRASHLPLCE